MLIKHKRNPKQDIYIQSIRSLKNGGVVVKTNKRPQIVLVLSGGSLRGFAHLGALQFLEEHDVKIQVIVGTSVGAIVGTLVSLRNDAIYWKYEKQLNLNDVFAKAYGLHSFNQLRLAQILNQLLGKSNYFKALNIALVAVTSDLYNLSGYPIYQGMLVPALIGSSALPGIGQPIHYRGKILFDGGVVDQFPLDYAVAMKPKIIIGIDLSDVFNRSAYYSSRVSAIPRFFQFIFYTQSQQAYLFAKSKNPNIILVKPHFGIIDNLSTFDSNQRFLFYDLGYQAMKKKWPTLKKLLIKYHIPFKP